ncbi:MAG: response regulator transcription factor [Candidatus Udaeobacter sp.]
MRKKSHQIKRRIRVMLVDDHAGMREALRTMINAEGDLAVVAEVDGGRAALEILEDAKPDVVLMDGSMPEMNGMEATRQLKQCQPAIKIIGLTLYDESSYLEEMVAAGAKGYVLKTDAPMNVAKAIRAVAAGGSYFDNVVSRSAAVTSEDEPVVEELNADELEVIKRVADGRTNVEIGADLELTLPVVERHRTAAMQKLRLRSRAELVRVAAQRHWLNA